MDMDLVGTLELEYGRMVDFSRIIILYYALYSFGLQHFPTLFVLNVAFNVLRLIQSYGFNNLCSLRI